MRTVQSLDEIKNNINVIDDYLKSIDNDKISFAKRLIKRGICFIVVEYKNEYRFYPSRFIGYANNNMDNHEKNDEKDGKETNPAISKILNCNPIYDDKMEEIYKDYCEILGFKANKSGAFGVQKKYWVLPE